MLWLLLLLLGSKGEEGCRGGCGGLLLLLLAKPSKAAHWLGLGLARLPKSKASGLCRARRLGCGCRLPKAESSRRCCRLLRRGGAKPAKTPSGSLLRGAKGGWCGEACGAAKPRLLCCTRQRRRRGVQQLRKTPDEEETHRAAEAFRQYLRGQLTPGHSKPQNSSCYHYLAG